MREPTVASGLNALLVTVRWLENGALRDLDNNVHLAQAVSVVRRQETSQSHIQAIRQGKATDPRWSVLCAICDVLSERSGVAITPNYFYDPAERTRVNDQLTLRLEVLQDQLLHAASRGRSGR